MRLPHRAIHLDFHTMPAVNDVGVDFDAEEFAQMLDEARVDFITVFAQCNLGMAYYPTKVGTVHPSLQRDLLGEMVTACHGRDIAVAAYWNAGLDHEAALRQRDWAILGDDGRVYGEDHLDHFFRSMCFGSGWADHLAAMIEEVLDGYEIDGVFLDCWHYGIGCQGYECALGMKESGMDPTDPAERIRYQNGKKMDFIRRVRKMIDEKRPEATYFLNGIPYDLQLSLASHIDVESLPCGGWGYDDFPWKVRYLRKRSDHVVRMTGRFHRCWGDFGGLRTQAGLDYDCFQAISHAAACGIGDHMHPRGRLNAEVYRRIGSIYRRIEALDEWTDNAQALTEMAVVLPAGSEVGVNVSEDQGQIVGATRALGELKQQFDILGSEDDWSGYAMLILLDGVRVNADGLKKLKDHLAGGGKILSSGTGGMLAEADEWPEEWGLRFGGPETCDPSFVVTTEGFCPAMCDCELTMSGPGVALEALAGTERLAEVVQPYFNRHWDGFHGHVYLPPDKAAGRPAITRKGAIIHFASAVFLDYAANANPLHRKLVGPALDILLENPLLRVRGLPSFGRLNLTVKAERTMVHILCYVPELRTKVGNLEIIEEPITAREVEVSLRKQAVKGVYLAPSRSELPFAAEGDRVRFTVPEVVGYQMVVVE